MKGHDIVCFLKSFDPRPHKVHHWHEMASPCLVAKVPAMDTKFYDWMVVAIDIRLHTVAFHGHDVAFNQLEGEQNAQHLPSACSGNSFQLN